MQAPISPQKTPSTPPRWTRWSAPLLLAALAAGVMIARSRHEQALPGKASPGGREKAGMSYENRALWRSPAPSPEQPEARRAPVITGIIYGIEGEPIAGARVLAGTFQVAGNIPTTAGSAESDEHGRFELRLPEGSYYVNADKPGYGPSMIQAHSGDTVSLVLPKSGAVEGHVYDERHAPVKHFTIDVVTVTPDIVAATPPLFSKTFDSPDGSYRIDQLPGFSVAVRATSADKAPAYSAPMMIPAAKTRQLDLVLSEGCAVTGTVEDKKGNPLPAVFVDAEARMSVGSMMESSAESSSQAKSDMQGHFRLDHVPTGQVLVRAYDGANAVTTTSVDVSSCEGMEPVKLVMSDGGSIAGVVRGDDGAPLPNVRLMVMHKSIGFVNTLSDAGGRFRFDQIPPAVVRLEVQQGGQHLARMVSVKDEAVTEQDITLVGKGQGEIRGRVTAGGRALAGAQVMISSNYGADKGMGTYYAVTGEDGSYRQPSLPAGDYVIIVSSTLKVSSARIEPGRTETVDLDIADQPAFADSSDPKPSR